MYCSCGNLFLTRSYTAYIALTSSALARIEKGGSSATESLVASIKKLVSDNKIAYKHIQEVEFIDAVSSQALNLARISLS